MKVCLIAQEQAARNKNSKWREPLIKTREKADRKTTLL